MMVGCDLDARRGFPRLAYEDPQTIGNPREARISTLVSAFLCAGQSCTAGERSLIHQKVYDAFLDELNAAIARSIQLGDPFDPETTLGPLNNEPTAQNMDRHLADALERRVELFGGGARAEGFPTRLYYRPTVLGGVTGEMEVAREETFGPVKPPSGTNLRHPRPSTLRGTRRTGGIALGKSSALPSPENS